MAGLCKTTGETAPNGCTSFIQLFYPYRFEKPGHSAIYIFINIISSEFNYLDVADNMAYVYENMADTNAGSYLWIPGGLLACRSYRDTLIVLHGVLRVRIISTPIENLKNYENNARTHSDDQLREIADSIKNFGFNDPIECDVNGVVISGHGRLAAARLLGLTHVPVVTHTHLTDAAQKAYVIAANKIALNAGWNHDLLKGEFSSIINDDEFAATLTGFTQEEIDALMAPPIVDFETNEDSVPSVAKVARVTRGDVWLLGNHRLMCGDSTNVDDIDLLTNGQTPDVAYCDPPYGISIVGKDGGVGGGTKGKYRKVEGDDTTDIAIQTYDICVTLAKVVIFWGANYYCNSLLPSSGWIVWDKQDGKHVTFADCELAYTNVNKPARVFKHIWDGFRRDSEKGEMRVHPTQKPVALCVECLDEYAPKSKNVLELFGGSGSTLIACEKSNRNCFMMEIDEKYCDIIIERWETLTGKVSKREGA